MGINVLVVSLEGTTEEITEGLNNKIKEIESGSAEIVDIKVSYSREHGVDGFVIVYTIIYKTK